MSWGYGDPVEQAQQAESQPAQQEMRIEEVVRNSLRMPAGVSASSALISEIAGAIRANGNVSIESAQAMINDINNALAQIASDPNASVAVSGPAAAAVEAVKAHVQATNDLQSDAMGMMMAPVAAVAGASVAATSVAKGPFALGDIYQDRDADMLSLISPASLKQLEAMPEPVKKETAQEGAMLKEASKMDDKNYSTAELGELNGPTVGSKQRTQDAGLGFA